MCNAVRDHVGCLQILVSISEQREIEEKFGEFVFIYVFLIPTRTFIWEHQIS